MTRTRRLRVAALGLGAAVLSAGLSGCGGGGGTYTFTAVVQSGLGLFPGSHVQVLGLDQGDVTTVQNQGDKVVVTMRLPTKEALPADVHANVVAPEILGQRSVDLEPGYTGGPRLAAGAVIPESRTSVPVETNTILHQVTDYLKQIDPKQVHNLVSNLSQDLSGQGEALNQLIGHAATTIQLLADKGNALGQLNTTLAHLTGTLDSRTGAIESLITSYDQVSGVIAQERTELDSALSALSQASTQMAAFLNPNLGNVEKDIETLTTVGRTLDRNLASVDQILSSNASLFAGAKRAYDPAHLWLNLNVAETPGVTALILSDHLRDRLAGICRRVAAHHSQGLSQQAMQQLKACGDPNSGYFDPLFAGLVGAAGSATGTMPGSGQQQQQQYQKGLSMIPGLSPQQQQQLVNPGPGSSGSSTTSTTAPSASPPSLLPPLKPFQAPRSGTGSGGGLFGAMSGAVTGAARVLAHSFQSAWSWL